MKELLAILFSSLFFLSGISQEYNENVDKGPKTEPRLKSSGISYPVSVNGDVYKNFKIDYQISDRMMVQVQHFYEKFGTHEGTISSFQAKSYFKNNLYFLAGPESEFDTNQATGKFELQQVNLNVGIGHDVNTNLLLELNYRVRINNSKLESIGNPGIGNVFSLRASF